MTSTYHPAPSTSAGQWPALTCLCPTYGRFERLRDAVACFLLQDYPGPCYLVILNDAPKPVILFEHGTDDGILDLDNGRWVQVMPARRYANLGAKRQALLEAAQTRLVAHWDDDDLYLPWHLSAAVAALQAADEPVSSIPSMKSITCAKSRCAWWGLGPRECWELQGGVHHNTFEGQMVFRRERALELGGYPPKMSGQAAALLRAFERAGELKLYRPADEDVSYVYRWADGVGHVSACPGDGAARQMEWLKRNTDFGRDGKPMPLIPSGNPILWARARLAKQFRILLDQLKPRLNEPAWQRINTRMEGAINAIA
jgi:hypothetical protein